VASAAIGYVNADRSPHLVIVTGYPANAVSVLANKGGGRFAKGIAFATARRPLAVAIADLDGDGGPDLATANHSNSVSILTNTPGLCVVQDVKGRRLAVARGMIGRAGCRVGSVRRAYSRRVKPGRVMSQRPEFGTVRPAGGKVDLVVSRGARKP